MTFSVLFDLFRQLTVCQLVTMLALLPTFAQQLTRNEFIKPTLKTLSNMLEIKFKQLLISRHIKANSFFIKLFLSTLKTSERFDFSSRGRINLGYKRLYIFWIRTVSCFENKFDNP